jgi:hypothetical protein
MKKLLVVVGLILAFSVVASAQSVQVLAGGAISELKNPVEQIRNSPTLSVDAKYNIINKKSGWTFGPAFNFTKTYNVEVIPNYFNGMTMVDIYRNVNTYFGGVEVAKKAGPFRLGGGFYLGARKLHEDFDYQLVRKYRAFFEVPAGHFVFRPFYAEAEASGGFNQNRANRFGASVGIELY